MKTLKEVLQETELTIGEKIIFKHSNKHPKTKQKETIKVKIKDSILDNYLINIKNNYKEKTIKLMEKYERLRPLYESKRIQKEVIQEITLLKKKAGIFKWSSYANEFPNEYTKYKYANETEIKCKTLINDINVKEDVEYEYNISKFFKFYTIIDELTEDTYEVNTIYVGIFINRSGQLQHIYLSEIVNIEEKDFDEKVMDRL
jgi:hypothetical protein